MGGALDNRGTLGDMSGDFVGNYALGSKYAYGGAINNRGTLGDMNGDFIGNYVSGSNFTELTAVQLTIKVRSAVFTAALSVIMLLLLCTPEVVLFSTTMGT